MRISYFMVDAFADAPFGGNQAGVCVLDAPLETETMQKIAAENNLSETAFVIKNGGRYDLKWFTPTVEIELCGHATLGTAYVLSAEFDRDCELFTFDTLSGELTVTRRGDMLEMNFPTRSLTEITPTEGMNAAIGADVLRAFGGYNLMLILRDERTVRELAPNIAAIKPFSEYHGFIVTAKGDSPDFVSRFFAPKVGVDEDPVTGSTQTELVPFWSKELGKAELISRQLSKRGGTLYCKDAGERVLIAGRACMYMTGEISL